MRLFQIDMFGRQTNCLHCGQAYVQFSVEFHMLKWIKEMHGLPLSAWCCAQCNIEWSIEHAKSKKILASQVSQWG